MSAPGPKQMSRNHSVMTVQSNPLEVSSNLQGHALRVENINDAILITSEELLSIIKRLTSVE